jgi:hypothetical protein
MAVIAAQIVHSKLGGFIEREHQLVRQRINPAGSTSKRA